MQRRCEIRAERNLATVCRKWKAEGKYVCRHVVFFDVPSAFDSPCLRARSHADWCRALLMPALDDDLKCIVTDAFEPVSFQRIGILQAEMKRRNW